MAGRGRPFTKGNPGRTKGSKNRLPKGFKASIKRLFEELAVEEEQNWKETIRRSMRMPGPRGFPWVQLALYVLDGKPKETVETTPIGHTIIDLSAVGHCPDCKWRKTPQQQLAELGCDDIIDDDGNVVGRAEPEDPEQEVVVREPAPVRTRGRRDG